MKKILILGTTTLANDAVSTIFKDIAKYLNPNFSYTFLGIDEKTYIFNFENKKMISIGTPFRGLTSLFYRIKRKIYRFFKIDDYKLISSFLLNKIKRILQLDDYFLVISVSGNFSYADAAFRLSKKYNMNRGMIYLDPFTMSPIFKNKFKKRKKIEKKWIDKSTFVLYDADGIKPPFEKQGNKCNPFKIPLADHKSLFNNKNNIVIYGGNFYKNIRSPKSIICSSVLPQFKSLIFEIYSNWKGTDTFNIKWHKIIRKDLFINKFCESLAIAIVGNSGVNSYKSSKYLEAISYRMPIIVYDIDINSDDTLSKYPYAYCWNDNNVIDKIRSIDISELEKFDIYSIFPDRNPRLLASLLNEKVNKIS